MTQFEFYKSFQFVLELLIGTGIYMHRLNKKHLFGLRLGVSVGVLFLFAWLFPVIENNNSFYTSFIFVSIAIVMILLGKLLVFDESWLVVSFCGIAGYTTQHLCYTVYSLFIKITGLGGSIGMGFYGDEFTSLFTNPFHLAIYIFSYMSMIYICFWLFANKMKANENMELRISFVFVFSVFIFVIDILLNAMIVFEQSEQTTVIAYNEIYNILCCMVSLYLQFEVALRRKYETTLEVERRIWSKVREQYSVAKESIDLINMKAHDLKYQIRTLSQNGSISDAVVRDIEETIKKYETLYKTGNDALDTIMTEKMIFCNSRRIQMSCLLEGKELSFMKDEDIYVLFGNIIDNAIDAVMKLEEDKRVISLQVKKIDNSLIIYETNHYSEIKIKNGFLQTTKEDKMWHGFGLKSIKHICEEYGGTLVIQAENNVFTLNAMFLPNCLTKESDKNK